MQFIPADSTVLDIGAADGRMLETVSRHIPLADFASVEASPELAAKIPRNGYCARADNLPFPDNSFTRVISCATRKHVKNSLGMMREVARVLRQNGQVVILDPHPLVLRFGVIAGKFDPRYLHHFSYAGEVAEEMRNCGLKPIVEHNRLFVLTVGVKP